MNTFCRISLSIVFSAILTTFLMWCLEYFSYIYGSYTQGVPIGTVLEEDFGRGILHFTFSVLVVTLLAPFEIYFFNKLLKKFF